MYLQQPIEFYVIVASGYIIRLRIVLGTLCYVDSLSATGGAC